MDNYLSVLEDSLKKKLQILDELTDYTTQQQTAPMFSYED